MKERYIFKFSIDERPIFENAGAFFYSQLVADEQLAYGLFTEDPEGFTQVNDSADYEKIQSLQSVNSRLRLASIVGLDKDIITVAVEYAGEYEYFRLSGFKPEDITDDLALLLPSKITRKTPSGFAKPYNVNKTELSHKNTGKRS